jgi:hypothetical protein
MFSNSIHTGPPKLEVALTGDNYTKWNFTREKISNGTVKLQYIYTGQNAADCLTKAVTKQTLNTAKLILFEL